MRAFPCCFAVFLLFAACGGGGSSGAEPKSASDERGPAESSSNRGSAKEDESAGETPAVSEKSKGPSCDDGTCSLCGGGICPSGWYCDEKAAGGGACSWLAECAEKASCGCVARVLGSSCKCREEGGGLKVACD